MKRRARAWAASLLLALGCGAGRDAPSLVLLISVDTLRADELGAYGSRRGLTPQLDSLARESLVFRRAYAPAAFTLPSVAGLLTGHLPESLGIETNESGLPDGVATLATRLAAEGWQTGAVVGNFVLRRASGVARGFGHFDDTFPSHEGVRRWPERAAGDTTDAALAMLEGCRVSASSRCFLWVHYQDPHGPYEPPAAFREAQLPAEQRAADGATRLAPGTDHLGRGAIPSYQYLEGRRDVAWYRAGYRGEIAYTDEQVGRLLEGVRATGAWDDAVVVFTADHGEALGDHGVWFAHGAGLTDDQVHVPLLFRAPGLAAGRREDVASLLDVYPSLLGWLGVAPLEEDAARPGRDLLAADAAQGSSVPYMVTLRALPEPHYALIEEGFKFIAVQRESGVDSRLFELGREDADLSAAAPQVAARMRARLGALRAELRPIVAPSAPELSTEDRERLRALGYLDPEPGT